MSRCTGQAHARLTPVQAGKLPLQLPCLRHRLHDCKHRVLAELILHDCTLLLRLSHTPGHITQQHPQQCGARTSWQVQQSQSFKFALYLRGELLDVCSVPKQEVQAAERASCSSNERLRWVATAAAGT